MLKITNFCTASKLRKLLEKTNLVVATANKKLSAIDNEFDLMNCDIFPTLRQLVNQKSSEVYSTPLEVFNYWISISYENEEVVPHDHLDGGNISVATAILYLQAEENCGILTVDNKQYNPQTNDFYLFDAKCIHSVSKNNSLTPRICIAFDMKNH